MAEAAEAAEAGTAVEAALKLLQQGTDEAAIAGLLVFARHVPRPQFEAHSHRLREVLRTTKLLPRLLATEADAGAYQRLAVTILATLGNGDSLDPKAESDNEDADLLEPLQALLVRDLVEADDDYAQELFLALASLAQSLGPKTSLNAGTIDVLIVEVTLARQPQRTATAVQALQVFCHQVSLQQTARIATALHKAVSSESVAHGAVELGSLLVTLLNTHANGINKNDVDGSNNVFIKTDSPSPAQDIVQPAANAVIAALKHTSHLDAGARCSIFTLASTLCEHAGPAWPQLTTEDAGSASPVSFFLRMLGVELEVCFTDARYAWVENEKCACGEAKKTETASSTKKASATLEMTIEACVEAFTWATRFFTERLGPRAQGLLERLQWTHLPAAELLKCRDALHNCVRAMTRFVCVTRENASPNGYSLRRVEQVLARALGEYLADGTCEVMGQVEQADLGVSASSGGLDTLLYLVSRAADSWQPALSTVNVLLAAEACPCADELLHKHREQLGLALLRAVAAQEGRFASEKTDDFVSVPEAEATVLDAAELYHEVGGEERTWSAGSSVRATLDSWKGPIETQDPAMRFVGLQVHGCLLYLDICQSGWQAPRHKAEVDHVLAAATRAGKYNEATLHSFVFPRLKSLALSHASRHLP